MLDHSEHDNASDGNCLLEVRREAVKCHDILHQKELLMRHGNTGTGTENGGSGDDNIKEGENFDLPCPLITNVVHETLRITAHSIGAIRKVMKTEGWVVHNNSETETETSEGNLNMNLNVDKSYIIPYGAYVAVSHIVPNLKGSQEKLKFDPRNTELKYTMHDEYLFTTFSHGVHKCPGQKLAIMVSSVVFLIFVICESYHLFYFVC